MARDGFKTRKIKQLLEKAVTGYRAEKDVVDPIWNRSRFADVDSAESNNLSGESKKIH